MKGIKTDTDHHIIKKQSNKKEKYEKKGNKNHCKFSDSWNYWVRDHIFVNEFLDGQGISACVGMNPITFLTSDPLDFLGLLYFTV